MSLLPRSDAPEETGEVHRLSLVVWSLLPVTEHFDAVPGGGA